MTAQLKGREASLKRKLRRHLQTLGFTRSQNGALIPPNLEKSTYREMHATQRRQKLRENANLIAELGDWPLLHFATGSDVSPREIRPRLEIVQSGTASASLFRFASLLWQVPVSEGYGRRIRFLVWDEHNDKLIGLFALGDAVFNLKVRDEYVGWDYGRRAEALVNMMDAYVLGAVPPYNKLLGGKLVASLIRSQEVVSAFRTKYHLTTGLISGMKKNANLVAVSTTSALGRSSIYNRLKLGDITYFEPIGYTAGWGHFHIPDQLFEELRAYLTLQGDNYGDSFHYGGGSNWRIRTIRRALALLGMNGNTIQHGLPREVFFCSLASNAKQILKGERLRPDFSSLLSIEQISDLAKERWVIPRADRFPEYVDWNPDHLREALVLIPGGAQKFPMKEFAHAKG